MPPGADGRDDRPARQGGDGPGGPAEPFSRIPHPDRLDPGRSDYRAVLRAHDAAVAAGEAGYRDPATGLYVLTAAWLWARGSCCDQGCRHCPYLARPRPERSPPAPPVP